MLPKQTTGRLKSDRADNPTVHRQNLHICIRTLLLDLFHIASLRNCFDGVKNVPTSPARFTRASNAYHVAVGRIGKKPTSYFSRLSFETNTRIALEFW